MLGPFESDGEHQVEPFQDPFSDETCVSSASLTLAGVICPWTDGDYAADDDADVKQVPKVGKEVVGKEAT